MSFRIIYTGGSIVPTGPGSVLPLYSLFYSCLLSPSSRSQLVAALAGKLADFLAIPTPSRVLDPASFLPRSTMISSQPGNGTLVAPAYLSWPSVVTGPSRASVRMPGV